MLDLLTETNMIECRLAATLIDQRHKVSADAGEPVDRERSKVSRLVDLSESHLFRYLVWSKRGESLHE